MIEFGPKSLLGSSRRPQIGDKIRVFYRYGGGENGNITSKSINTTKSVLSDGNTLVNITFVNNYSGVGGEDAETVEHASVYAPLSIRTAEKTVTEDDYVDIGSLNSSVFKIKSYGNGNLDSNDVYNEYGEFIKPLEVWNYILMKKSGWTELTASEYKDFRWMELREENRFNESYGFVKGAFNVEKLVQSVAKTADLQYNPEQEFMTFNNYTIIDTPDIFKENFSDDDTKLKFSDEEVADQFWADINNYFGSSIIENTTPTHSIIDNTLHANRLSKDFTVIAIDDSEYIELSIDSRPSIQIPFASTDDTISELIDVINAELLGSADYGSSASFSQTIVSDLDPDTILDGTYNFKAVFDYTEVEASITKPYAIDGTFDSEMKSVLETAFAGETFTVTTTGAGPFDVLVETANGFIELKSSDTDDLFTATSTTDFGLPLGGGDYSAVAVLENTDYIRISSPNTGYNSKITFYGDTTIENNITSVFFDMTTPVGATTFDRTTYGYRRLTLITNPTETEGYANYYKKLVFEYNDFDFHENTNSRKYFYINYVYTNLDEIDLGTYFNTEFLSTNIKYREVANRVYNTYYDEDYKVIDTNLSDFYIKFTNEETDKISIYKIDNSWSLSPISELYIRSDYDYTPAGTVNLNINIDGLGDSTTSIEIGNSLQNIVDAINSNLQTDYLQEYPLYRYFEYATLEEDETGSYIKIKSPTKSKDSSIAADATALSGFYYVSSAPADSASVSPVGDYGFAYKYQKIIGSNLERTATIITTDVNVENIEVGYKLIYDVVLGNPTCFVTSITESEGNTYIELSEIIEIENSGVSFYFSDDVMKLQKNSSNFPDLNFYTHFVFDKRYKEDIYEDFPLLSLDEDIIKNYLSNYKIVGLENIFKKPKITTFDIVGEIYYNNKLYSSAEVKQLVEDTLEEKYKLDNRSFQDKVKRSIVISDIQNLTPVKWVNITYLGKDMNEGGGVNTANEIDCNFNEILTLAENKYASNVQLSGISFTYYKGA
jgi:hypothetical protein